MAEEAGEGFVDFHDDEDEGGDEEEVEEVEGGDGVGFEELG